MHTFSGKHPRVYALGESFEVWNAPLLDCGGGWDWCLPEGLHCWEGEVSFELWSGEWEPIDPLEVHYRSGVVAFARCLEGMSVRASGVCRPTSLLFESGSWILEVASVLQMAPVLGSDSASVRRQDLGASVFIADVGCDPQEDVFALLPFADGSFVGCGKLVSGLTGVTVLYDNEGVVYEPARPASS